MFEKICDLLIIGSGPAGVGAAIQASLYGLKVLVAGDGPIGGRLALARRVENFPIPSAGKDPSGPAVCRRLENWLKVKKIFTAGDCITEVGYSQGMFKTAGSSKRGYRSRAVILATGVRPKPWPMAGASRVEKRIVENWRQVPRPSGACVAVIGGGEVAFDQALSLAERGAEVILLMRGSKPRAHPGLVAEAARLGVGIVANMPVCSVRCDDRGALLKTGGGRKYCCDFVLPAVGHRPQLPELDRAARRMRDRGLWLAGDVRESLCRQAAVAFGDGVRAAMLAWEFLRRDRK